MVSSLWKACSDGDVDRVIQLLNDASPLDIELKDHTGVTPLIEAVKNGHLHVVRALLNKGADPFNASSQGRPEQYTSDPAVIELLTAAQSKVAVPNGNAPHENIYLRNGNDNSDKRYYAPPFPSTPYTYYPTINPTLSAMGEGGVYYPPPPPPPPQFDNNSAPNGLGHLPPPEIARLIPCRYFPACRYGPQCIFAHPQSPYYQAASVPPPAQYPPYDPMSGSYGYYPPPPFHQSNGTPITPLSPPPPQPHIMHGRSPSEIVSPSQTHFSPNAPAPSNPYSSLSPSAYPHPGQIPLPMAIPSLPPLHHQPPPPGPGPQSPPAVYNNSSLVPPFHGHDPSGQYMPSPLPAGIGYSDIDGGGKSPPFDGQHDVHNVPPGHRDGIGHRRGGAPRRGSFAGRKPPCLFFPSGRCKNGNECRFPHVMPDNSGSHHGPASLPARGAAPRPRGHTNGNGVAMIEQKMGSLAVRDGTLRLQNNGTAEGSSRSHSTDPGSRPKYQQGIKQHPGNVAQNNKKFTPHPKAQRVPNADEFPVLPGLTTPPTRNGSMNGLNGNGHHGPTAAQILQAPPPRKENGKDSSTRGATPESVRSAESDPAKATLVPDQLVPKLPISFAAAATGAPDVSKEVSVSA